VASAGLAEFFPLAHFLRIVRGVVLHRADLGQVWLDIARRVLPRREGGGGRPLPQASGRRGPRPAIASAVASRPAR